jgi:hypothetical protein
LKNIQIIFSFFLTWEIYDISPLIVPIHEGVVIRFANLFDYLSFNLIVQHISFCEKFEIIKITKNSAQPPPPPFFFNVMHQLSKRTKVVHVEKKVKKNGNVKIGKIRGTPKTKGS